MLSDGHPRIVLSKALTSSYKVRLIKFWPLPWSTHSSSTPEHPAACNKTPRLFDSWITYCERLDIAPSSYAVIRSCPWSMRTCSWVTGRSLRVKGHPPVGRWNATDNGASRRYRSSTPVEVCRCLRQSFYCVIYRFLDSCQRLWVFDTCAIQAILTVRWSLGSM